MGGSVSPYKEKIYALLDNDPLIDESTALLAVECNRATWYNWKKRYLEDELPARLEAQEALKKRQHKKIENAKNKKQALDTSSLKTFNDCIEALEDFIMFCGFRGYYAKQSAYEIITTNSEKKLGNKACFYIEEKGKEGSVELNKSMLSEAYNVHLGYVHPVVVYEGAYHEGVASPPPIDEQGRELGVLYHELEGFVSIWFHLWKGADVVGVRKGKEGNKLGGILIKWARGFGKTYLATWYVEWSMYRMAYPWMYLSSTAVISDVAYWIWLWAVQHDLIVKSKKGGKQKTYRNFDLKNGARMRIYDYMGEEMVGQHGWYVAMDDVVKKKWEDKPTDNLKAKRQWLYSLKWMRRKGLMIFGTRKYIDDLLEFFENVIKDLHIEVRTPYVMEGAFPDWIPKLDADGKEVLWVPELYSYEDLEEKKTAPTEDGTDPLAAWQAEMMQDPRPIAGKRWKSVAYETDLKHMNNYDYMYFYVDRATTVKSTSDYTGFLQGIREFSTGIRVIINDYTDHWTLEQLAFIICKKVDLWHRQYEHMGIILIIEKQGGGDDFEAQIKNRDEFVWHDPPSGNPFEYKDGDRVKNFIRMYCHIRPETSSGDKKKRIQDRLGAPIDNKMIRFRYSLKKSEVVNNVLDFPYNKKIDAIDALSFDFYLMQYFPISEKGYIEDIVIALDAIRKGQIDDKRKEKDKKNKLKSLFKKEKRRVVFQ